MKAKADAMRTLFDQGWEYARAGVEDWTPVSLPHDAMIHEQRDPGLPSGHNTGWYPGGAYTYRTTWMAPASGQHVALLFEGVYRLARVVVNGTDAGGCLSGYTEFEVPIEHLLRWGEDNLIEVHVDNSEQPNSRWYSGSGIYRQVWLVETGAVRIAQDGVRVVTRSVADPAVVDVEVQLDNPEGVAACVSVELSASSVVVARADLTGDALHAGGMLAVASPQPWSADEPHLYDCLVTVTVSGDVVDVSRFRIGLRTIAADATHGFVVNGRSVKLRGACVHHDHGVLGAATFRDAEFRRARLLKAQGFNAIRSSHQPMSRDALDACDEVGLYVIDELWDSWLAQKTAHDLADRFAEFWESDVDATVGKDRNHACVVMYSTGNEIGESATPQGIQVAQDVAARLRTLDPTRLITSGVNPLLNMSSLRGKNPALEQNQKAPDPTKKANRLQSEGFNLLMGKLGTGMTLLARLPAADRAMQGVASTLDVVGYNYGTGRYSADAKAHPGRVIVGSETMPYHIAKNWALVERLPYLVGDFMWTGWDYLGESGIGSWSYGDEPAGMRKPYPWSVAGPGALDLLGQPGAPMLLARAVWGLDDDPAIAVRPVDRAAEPVHKAVWRASDAVPSWSWSGCEGKPARIEVYSGADTIELLLNGRSLGRRPAGRRHGFTARFTVPWEPGELTAVAYTGGREIGRRTLAAAAGPLSLRVTSDRSDLTANGQDLAHVLIEVVDAAGTVDMVSNEPITATLTGPGTLVGLGSAHPAPPGPYTDADDHTWQGRALAVIRASREAGPVTLTVTSPLFGRASAAVDLHPI